MAYKPVDWLGPLIEQDIQAAIQWYNRTGSNQKVKRDPGSRFEDDGSNLRSELEALNLSDDANVQIVRVLSVEDPLLLISDGFTCVKARLSATAIASIENDIGEAIDLDTRGDIFAIRKCTVVSTPYGPTEGHVQLVIEDIKYHFHLRKIAGTGSPVGERPAISRLMNEVMRIRHPEPAEETTAQMGTSHSKSTESRTRRSEHFETQAEPQSPASQASIIITSSPPASQPAGKQQNVATQVPVRRRKHAPNMAQDGIEMAVGVNLERPTAAMPSRFAQNPPGQAKSAAISERSADLLSVLGKRKAQPEAQTAPVIPMTSTENAISLPGNPQQPNTQQAASVAGSPTIQPTNSQPPSELLQETPRPAQGRVAIASTQASAALAGKSHWRQRIPSAQKRLLDSPASWLPPLPGRQFPHPNVPIELLKQWNEQAERKPESVVFSQSQPKQSQEITSGGSQMAAGAANSDSESSSEEDSDDELLGEWPSSPAEHALPSKGMTIPVGLPSQAQQVKLSTNVQSSPMSSSPPELSPGQMPPTSTIDSLSRPSTAGKRPELPPDSSFEHPIAPRALGQQQTVQTNPKLSENLEHVPSPRSVVSKAESTRQQASPSSSNHRRPSHGLPPKPTFAPSPTGLFAPSTQPPPPFGQQYGLKRTQGALQYRPPPPTAPKASSNTPIKQPSAPTNGSSTPKEVTASTREKAAFMSPNSHVRHVSQSPAQGRSLPHVPPSTGATVIKGTQMSRPSDAEVIEIDAPRDIDPALEHQKRRSEYLKGEQRRKWVKANPPHPNKPFSLGPLWARYKKAHPKDELKTSELAEAYHDVFPNTADDAGNDRAQAALATTKDSTASPNKSTNVASTTVRQQASMADIDDSDSTPSEVPIEPGVRERRESERGSTVEGNLNGAVATEHRKNLEATKGKDAIARFAYSPPTQQPQHLSARIPGASHKDGTNEADTTIEIQRLSRKATRRAAKQDQSERRKNPPSTTGLLAVVSTGPLSSASGNGKATPDHHSWFVKRIESDQRRLKNDDLAGVGGDGASFREFAGAWRDFRPGGAFVEMGRKGSTEWRTGEEQRQKSKRRKERVRLDVLGWEL